MARVWWALPLLIASSACGASFDCAKAKTPQEKAICASPQASAADSRMAAAYRAALAATPADMASRVKADQRAWLADLPLYCPSDHEQQDEPLSTCLRDQLRFREKDLQKLVQRKGGIVFVWRSHMLKSADKDYESGEIGLPRVLPGYDTLEISWPQSNAKGPEWAAWNRAIEEAAGQRAGASGELREIPLEAAWKREWAAGDDGDVTVTIGVVTPHLVTAFVDRWGYIGAHPSEDSIQLNWMLHERRELETTDVFRDGSGWKDYLVRRCDEELGLEHLKQDIYDPAHLSDVLTGIVAEPRNWKLDAKGLSIVFQDYEIMPRMDHPGPVLVPWNALEPYLNPNFVLASDR